VDSERRVATSRTRGVTAGRMFSLLHPPSLLMSGASRRRQYRPAACQRRPPTDSACPDTASGFHRISGHPVPRHRRVSASSAIHDSRFTIHDSAGVALARDGMSLRKTDVIHASSASAWRRPPPTDRADQEHVSTVLLRTYRPTPSPCLPRSYRPLDGGQWSVVGGQPRADAVLEEHVVKALLDQGVHRQRVILAATDQT